MYAKVCWKMGTWPGTEYLGTMVVEARMARCFCHLDGMIICAFEASTMVHLLRFATEIAQGSESRAKKPQTCQVDVEANQIHKSTNTTRQEPLQATATTARATAISCKYCCNAPAVLLVQPPPCSCVCVLPLDWSSSLPDFWPDMTAARQIWPFDGAAKAKKENGRPTAGKPQPETTHLTCCEHQDSPIYHPMSQFMLSCLEEELSFSRRAFASFSFLFFIPV